MKKIIKNILNNEDYIKILMDNMSDFVDKLYVQVGINKDEEFIINTIENATPQDIEKFEYYYDTAIYIINYYINRKKCTNYINEFADFIGTMLFLLGGNIKNDFDLYDKFYDKIQEYNTMLLDNNIPFNRTIIPISILYDDFPENNQFIQKLKNNINQFSFTDEELNIIRNFNEDSKYIWENAKLI